MASVRLRSALARVARQLPSPRNAAGMPSQHLETLPSTTSITPSLESYPLWEDTLRGIRNRSTTNISSIATNPSTSRSKESNSGTPLGPPQAASPWTSREDSPRNYSTASSPRSTRSTSSARNTRNTSSTSSTSSSSSSSSSSGASSGGQQTEGEGIGRDQTLQGGEAVAEDAHAEQVDQFTTTGAAVEFETIVTDGIEIEDGSEIEEGFEIEKNFEEDEAFLDATVGQRAARVAPLPDDFVPSLGEQEVGEAGGWQGTPRRHRGRGARGSLEPEVQEEERLPYPRFMSEGAADGDGIRRRAAKVVVASGGKGRKGKGAGAGSVGMPDELSLMDAIRKVKESAKAKFDETVEVHVRLGVDPKRSDMTVRGSAVLPRGSGKLSRVAVFAEGSKAEEALAAGADIVGGAELIQQIKDSGGKLEFDKCIAIPPMMPKLTQVARILGPRGLMPNPKMGTVTMNVAEAVATAKRGKADFRADKTGNVHCGVGKVSFPDEALRDNIAAVAAALLAAKPAGLKKTSRFSGYFTTFTISSTMGAGVRTSVPSLSLAVDAHAKSEASA